MGTSVAGAGDVDGDGYDDVLVGAPSYGGGAAFVFTGSATGVGDGGPSTAEARLGTAVYANLGRSVAGAGDVDGDGYDDIIVGAPGHPELDPALGAFVLRGSATGIPDGDVAATASHLAPEQPYGGLGSSVSGAGDVNGDGYDDVIVGAQYLDAGGAYYPDPDHSDDGAAFIFLGGAAGIPSGSSATAFRRFDPIQEGANLGADVAGAGDTDGDGLDDVIVGAPYFDGTGTDDGVALLFLPEAGGTPSLAAGLVLLAALARRRARR